MHPALTSPWDRAKNALTRSLFHSDIDDDDSTPLEIYDLGQLTPQCGRKGDALKLFLSLQYYGLEYYEQAIDAAFDRAKRLYDTLKSNNHFEVVTPQPPECLQVCQEGRVWLIAGMLLLQS